MKIIVLFFFVVSLFADNASYNRGETIFFARGCSSCHGPSAEGSTSYPRLANKKKKFLVKKLNNFRAGKADSVSQEMMAQFASSLSDKEIEDLSNFLANHKKNTIKDVDDDILGGFGS